MDHWFDNLTRKLATRQTVSRRAMLSWSAKASVALSGAGLIGRTPTEAHAAVAEPTGFTATLAATTMQPEGFRAPITPATPGTGGCVVDDSYGLLRTVVAASVQGRVPLTLRHTFSAEVATGNAFSTITVKSPGQADDLVLRLSTTALADRGGRAQTLLGRPFAGSAGRKDSSFYTDGTTVQGTVDARQTEAVPLASDVKGLRFKDGRPGDPDVALAPDLQQAIAALLTQARSQLGTCTPDASLPPAIAKCTKCQLDCRDAWLKCSIGSAQSSLAAGSLAAASYLASAGTNCDAVLQRCFQTCKSSGACCPDYCKGDAKCCDSSWGCCPPSPKADPSLSRAWPTCPRCGPVTTAPEVKSAPPRQPRGGNQRGGQR